MTSPQGDRPMECAEVRVALPELALGILTGRERSEVLAHLYGCESCSAEEEQLTRAADALLELGPEVEPPVGFEVRLAERMAATMPAPTPIAHRRRPARVLLAVAAVVLLAALAVGFGIGRGTANGPAPTRSAVTAPEDQVARAMLTADGESRGAVATYSGSPGWLQMTVRDLGYTGYVTCRITLPNGTTTPVGTFWVNKGYGAWSVPLTVAPSKVEGASLVSTGGTVLASASFPA